MYEKIIDIESSFIIMVLCMFCYTGDDVMQAP